MKPSEQGKENERSPSGKDEVVGLADVKAGEKKSSLREADGIIHGDTKKAGEAFIQEDKERSGR
jgi:hypothetical protein